MEGSVWQELPGGVLRVRFSIGAVRLFGMPFLLVGGYLAYQDVMGIVESVQSRSADAAVGLVLLAGMAAAFVVPGFLITLFRRTLDIDTEMGEMREVKDFLVTKRTRVHRISDFQSVTVRKTLSRSKVTGTTATHQTRADYSVELERRSPAVDSDRFLVVSSTADPALAVQQGKRVATKLGLSVHDKSGGVTRINAYSGIASALLIRDPSELNLINQGLPNYYEKNR